MRRRGNSYPDAGHNVMNRGYKGKDIFAGDKNKTNHCLHRSICPLIPVQSSIYDIEKIKHPRHSHTPTHRPFFRPFFRKRLFYGMLGKTIGRIEPSQEGKNRQSKMF
jgi:hypothetical protein